MTENTHSARIETRHDDPEIARRIAATLRPDNTAEMETRVENDRIVTIIQRDGTGGLQTTVDDYIVNLHTAEQLATQDGDTSTHETEDT